MQSLQKRAGGYPRGIFKDRQGKVLFQTLEVKNTGIFHSFC
jgi:hypothetical protein